MARSLKAQLQHSVCASFHGDEGTDTTGGFGKSKHSDKISGQKAGKIYSYDTYNNRKAVAREFGDFMRQYHPEIKMAKDITKAHATEFIAKKASEVSTSTLNYYRSEMKGLAENLNHTFSTCNADFSTLAMSGVVDHKVKDISMTTGDYRKLVDSYSNPMESNGAVGAQVAWASGLRAHEVCALKGTDIKIENDKAVVHVANGKGGRMRDVEVSDPQRVQTLRDISEYYGGSKVCDINPHSLEVNISRHLKQIDSEQNYKYNSVHSIRKEYAQETYDQLKAEGYSQDEAWGKVCENLGHSASRSELFKAYISKP